jgi:hypothetical protein
MSDPGTSRARGAIIALLLGLGPLLPGLVHGFYRDDFWWLEQAFLSLHDPLHLFDPWLSGFFRPLGQTAFFAQFLVFRFEPLPYNLVSLALHGWAGYLVGRLAAALGGGRAVAIVLFLVGTGHFAKPVMWACSQPILIATSLLLIVVLRMIEDVRGGVSRGISGNVLLFVVGASIPFFHDLFGLAPLGLAAFAVLLGHRSRKWLASAWLGGGLLVLALTAPFHARVSQENGIGWHVIANGIHYLAVLVAPVVNGESIGAVLNALIARSAGSPASGNPGGRAWISLVPTTVIVTIGIAVAIVLIVGWNRVRRGGVWQGTADGSVGAVPSRRTAGDPFRTATALAALGACLLVPALIVDHGVRWIDARYAYPFSSVLTPLLVLAGRALFARGRHASEDARQTPKGLAGGHQARHRSAAEQRGGTSGRNERRRRVEMTLAVIWYLLVLVGSIEMIRESIAEGNDPRTAERWERIESVRRGGAATTR